MEPAFLKLILFNVLGQAHLYTFRRFRGPESKYQDSNIDHPMGKLLAGNSWRPLNPGNFNSFEVGGTNYITK